MAFGVHETAFEGGAQPLVHVPPSRVASATAAIENLTVSVDSPDRFVLASAPAIVDTYSATLTAAAGAGQADPRLMTHASSSATAGNSYVIETVDGRHELFVAEAVSATTIRTAAPLSGAYPIGSLVRGVQLSCTFPAPAAADEQLFDGNPPLRVRWIYTTAAGLHMVDELVLLVRGTPAARYLGAVELDMRTTKQELVRLLGTQGATLRNLIASVARRLTSDLRSKSIEPDRFLNGDEGFELLKQACVLEIAEDGIAPASMNPSEWAALQAQKFGRMWMQATRGTDSTTSTVVSRESDTADAGSSKQRRSPWRRG